MNNMVDIPKVEHDESPYVGSESHYPYGTSLSFEGDMVDQLGLSECQIGDEVMVYAKAKIISRSEREDENESDRRVEVQLTSIDISKSGDEKSRDDVLYGEE